MLQQVMTNPGEIIFREVSVPEIKDDQVLVKIMNIGILLQGRFAIYRILRVKKVIHLYRLSWKEMKVLLLFFARIIK